jgi:hypothetical protein
MVQSEGKPEVDCIQLILVYQIKGEQPQPTAINYLINGNHPTDQLKMLD